MTSYFLTYLWRMSLSHALGTCFPIAKQEAGCKCFIDFYFKMFLTTFFFLKILDIDQKLKAESATAYFV